MMYRLDEDLLLINRRKRYLKLVKILIFKEIRETSRFFNASGNEFVKRLIVWFNIKLLRKWNENIWNLSFHTER